MREYFETAPEVSESEPATRTVTRTSETIRRIIQQSDQSNRALARQHGLDRRTVAKWRKRDTIEDERRGAKARGPWALRVADEMIISTFRRFTQLPLDDCLYALKPAIPNLTRSSLQRCLLRHRLNRLDEIQLPNGCEGADRPGWVFVYVARIITDEGTMYSYTAFDQFTKLVYSQQTDQLCPRFIAAFARSLVDFLPYPVARISTNDEELFTSAWQDGLTFTAICEDMDIVHQVVDEQMLWQSPPEEWNLYDRKDMPRYSSRYQTREGEALCTHRWTQHYTFNARLKALKGLTPYAYLCQLWESHPDWFQRNPEQLKLDAGNKPH